MKDIVTVGVVGAGRALELHAFGYKRSNIPCRLKTVMARRAEQINTCASLLLPAKFSIAISKLSLFDSSSPFEL